MNTQEVLQSVGYPEDCLVLDFESYYDAKYSLSKMSIIEYIKDEQFELLGCGFGSIDNTWFVTPSDLKDYISGLDWFSFTTVVKNAKFDVLILQEIFGITPTYIIDVEDLSRHLDSRAKHSLKELAVRYKLGTKGRTEDFKGLHWADMDKTKRKALADYCLNDVSLEYQLFELLLPQLTNPTLEIPLMRHTLDVYLNPMINFDFEKADELIEAMGLEMLSAIAKTTHTAKDIRGDISFAKLLLAALGDDAVPTKPGKPTKNMIKLLGKSGVIPALAQDDEGRKILLEHPNKQVQLLIRTRIAAKKWPLHIKRVRNLIAQAKANSGKLAVPLKYYGAHTGRWSGSGGINLQNLGGAGRGKAIHPLIGAVRGLLYA